MIVLRMALVVIVVVIAAFALMVQFAKIERALGQFHQVDVREGSTHDRGSAARP